MNIRERKPRLKKANSALYHLSKSLIDFWSMMSEERLNALSFVYIHQDIFFDYDKIIEIYAYK